MKNLKNVDLEVLEVIPTRISFHRRIDIKLREQFTQDHYYHGNDVYKYAHSVFKGLVGKHLSVIQRKIRKILYFEQPNYFLHYVSPAGKGSFYWGYYYFDANDFLCYHEGERRNYKNLPQHQRIQESKRKWKVERIEEKKLSLVLLTLINNKPLFDFYRELCSNRRYEKTNLEKVAPAYSGNFFKRWLERYSYNRWKIAHDSAAKKLTAIEEDIRKIESGDYTPFYKSKGYLYSIGKECPHMESPKKVID